MINRLFGIFVDIYFKYVKLIYCKNNFQIRSEVISYLIKKYILMNKMQINFTRKYANNYIMIVIIHII